MPLQTADTLSFDPPRPDDVLEAASRLRHVARRTPLLQSARLNELAGGTVFVKLESLQHTGAFKFRGAYNSMSRLDRTLYPRGEHAYSTDDNGQAIETGGRILRL